MSLPGTGLLARMSAGALPQCVAGMSWHSAVGRPDAILVRGPETGPTARATVPLMERRYGHDYDSVVDFCGPPSTTFSKAGRQGIFPRATRAMGKLYQSVAGRGDDSDSRPKFPNAKKNGANAAPFPCSMWNKSQVPSIRLWTTTLKRASWSTAKVKSGAISTAFL